MQRLVTYDPFGDAGFDDLFRGFFRPVRNGAPTPASIKMDVTERDGGYVVHAEIPGAKKEDVHVTIEGNQVTISAEVKRESEKKEGETVLRSERYYGSAFRSFTLPVDLDEGVSTAKFENGVLELTLAKKPALAGKKLTIQ
jgi:HSP20 family protein